MKVARFPEISAAVEVNVKILTFLAKQMNETIEWVFVSDDDFPPGTQSLKNNEVDVIPNIYAISLERTSIVPYSYPVVITKALFKVPVIPDPLQSAKGLLRVFSPELWLSVILIGMLFMMPMFLLSWIGKGKVVREGYTLSVWDWFKHFIGQDGLVVNIGSRSRSFVVTMLLTSLFSLFTFTLYDGFMLVILMEPRAPRPTITNLDELIDAVQNRQARLLLFDPQHNYYRQILSSTSPSTRRLAESLQQNPVVFITDGANADGPPLVQLNPEIYTVWRFNLTYADCADYVYVPAEGISNSLMGFPFAAKYANANSFNSSELDSSSSLLNRFNKAIIDHYSTIQTMVETYVSSKYATYEMCRRRAVDEGGLPGDPLKLNVFLGGFLLLSIGALLACISFGFERFLVF